MSLTHVPVHPTLRRYIEKVWVFESDCRVPNPDMKIIVPNGMVKLIIPFCNGISGQRKDYYKLSKTDQITLIGISDAPFVVDAEKDAPFGTIGIEFSSLGAYRFFRLRHCELKNQIFLAEEVLGKTCCEIQTIISEAPSALSKVRLILGYLLKLFSKTTPDSVFEFCVRKIRESNGTVPIRKLEQETGYSARWLNMKFEERLGISPKNLCAIARFQLIYQAIVNKPDEFLRNRSYYGIYYDQSHFIREFKRFTGLPPATFQRQNNDFGRIFYKD